MSAVSQSMKLMSTTLPTSWLTMMSMLSSIWITHHHTLLVQRHMMRQLYLMHQMDTKHLA